MLSNPESDTVVTRIHAQYAASGFKPSNSYQFTILAAFLLGPTLSGSPGRDSKIISLATGSKCLPTARFPERGDALHDSHAEVLARRGAIRWFYEEVRRTMHTPARSKWIEYSPLSGKWSLKEGVELLLYVSAVPCGDASTRLLALTQDPTMAALKNSTAPPVLSRGTAARGRDGYAHVGVLRTKPGRADSPSTLCMSCSDKIAAWNVLGVQGALGARVFGRVEVGTIIIGDVPQELREVVREDCERALFGRLTGIDDLPNGYGLSKSAIVFTSEPFTHSRTSLQALHPEKPPPNSSNESLCWVADSSSGAEVIINGSRRGVGASRRGLEKYRPCLCKLSLYKLHADTLELLGISSDADMTYYDAKRLDAEYYRARQALKGATGPFYGWAVSGRGWESFTVDGTIAAASPPGKCNV